MEDFFIKKFNDTLSASYVLLNRFEQNMFNSSKRFNLSVSELSMLEVINKSPVTGKMVGDIATELMITPSSVTIAVNRLEKKGYVARHKSETDGRQVYVNLTERGRHADRIHKRFRRNMAKDIFCGMKESEKCTLIKCMERMNKFLTNKINGATNKETIKKSA
ncbi:MAG: MarR family transcriptional regulator [Acutalibacteraceae bacterium]|nr:MarR family transcriptional regulator [Acutalibacteraceae bacterium]